MKLNTKVAGICASLTFLITAIPGFYQQARPTDFNFISVDSFSGMAVVETLVISLLGSLAAGMIGYLIGDILSHPQKPHKATAPQTEAKAVSPVIQPDSSDSPEGDFDLEAEGEPKAPSESITETGDEAADLE